MKRKQTLLPLTALLAVLLGIHGSANAQVLVDTSALSGQSGFVDFQFNPGTSGSTPLDATVTINGFSGGTLGAVDLNNSANEVGALPGPVTITNTGAVNSLVQAITFGNSITFTPSFMFSPTPGVDEGNTYQLFLLDADQNTISTLDPSGLNSVVTIQQDLSGGVSVPQVFSVSVSTVPEPSPCAFLGVMLLAASPLCARTLWKRRRRA